MGTVPCSKTRTATTTMAATTTNKATRHQLTAVTPTTQHIKAARTTIRKTIHTSIHQVKAPVLPRMTRTITTRTNNINNSLEALMVLMVNTLIQLRRLHNRLRHLLHRIRKKKALLRQETRGKLLRRIRLIENFIEVFCEARTW